MKWRINLMLSFLTKEFFIEPASTSASGCFLTSQGSVFTSSMFTCRAVPVLYSPPVRLGELISSVLPSGSTAVKGSTHEHIIGATCVSLDHILSATDTRIVKK